MYHYKHAGPEADPEVIAKARVVQTHLNKCTEAQKLRDWNNLIKESGRAISAGADSAPQVSINGHTNQKLVRVETHVFSLRVYFDPTCLWLLKRSSHCKRRRS